MPRDDLSRRDVLRGLGVGTVGLAGAGSASAAGAGNAPDRHIVGVSSNRGVRAARSKADAVHRMLDFGSIGQAVAGRFSDEALDALQNNPNVRYVERDGTMQALAQELPWGVDRIDAEVAHAKGDTGSGADIAIVDTGIDSDHPDLQANVGAGKAFVDCEPLGSRPGGCGFGVKTNDNPCNKTWDDDNDHGSHVSGSVDAVDDTSHVVGVSTQATLHAVKVLDACGSGTWSDVAAGIKYVADQGWDVANMSLGGDKSSAVEDAVEYAHGKGVLLVAAAGNDGPCSDCVGYPAAEPEVVAVSATSSDDSLADFSSTGPEVELAAPGEDIVSTVPPESDSDGLASFDGTSMASPHVAGAGGLLMANGYSNTNARDRLRSTAEDIGLGSNEQGSGLVDAAAALGYDSSDDLGGSDSNSSPAVDSLSATEVETSDADAEFDVDWSVSDSDGNLDTVDLTLTDDTDGETEDTASISVSGDSASDTTHLVAADDDGSANSYTVEATVTDTDGATDTATTSVSESEDTSGGDNAPTIDSWSKNSRNTGPWFRVESNWTVSDADGDLDTVTTELLDSGGNILDSASSSVSGGSASGSHEVRTRDTASDVKLIVTDQNGNTTTDSKTV